MLHRFHAAFLALACTTAAAAPVYEVIAAFDLPPESIHAPLWHGADGTIYGTGSYGGAYRDGAVWRIKPGGSFENVGSIKRARNSNYPAVRPSSVVGDAAGNLYFCTALDGSDGTAMPTNGHGTIRRVLPDGTVQILVEFTGTGGAYPGSYPAFQVAMDSDGNFYGMTGSGGGSGMGNVFRLAPDGTYTVLVDFNGTNGENQGSSPHGIVWRPSGDLIGTTNAGTGFSTVFRITADGTHSVLANFSSTNTTTLGAYLESPLLLTSDGSVYGRTNIGGQYGRGTIYRVAPDGTFSIATHLNSPNVSWFSGAMVLGTDGNFYAVGAAGLGGTSWAVYRITPDGNANHLVALPGQSAGNSYSGITTGADGAFYGATTYGSSAGGGTVFRVTEAGELSLLWENEWNGLNAYNLTTGPTEMPDGSLIVAEGGLGKFGDGKLIQLANTGVSNLTHFSDNGPEPAGSIPFGTLARGQDGAFFGTTYYGGGTGIGTMFRMTTSGSVTHIADLPATARNPLSGLVAESAGTFVGYSSNGGAAGKGTVFRATAAGAVSTLVEFTGTLGAAPGSAPSGQPLALPDGSIIGTTSLGGAGDFGTVFRIDSSGVFSTLAEFTGTTGAVPGSMPSALVLGDDGAYLGTTGGGGANGKGTIFHVASNGTFTSVFSLPVGVGTSSFSSTRPNPLVPDGAGGFFGSVAAGGSASRGVIFHFAPPSTLTILHTVPAFNAVSPPVGRYPSGLALLSDGNLYGIFQDGPRGAGGVFRIGLDAAPGAFADWKTTHLDSTSIPDLDDTDSDTLTLIEEYAGAYNPHTADLRPAPAITGSGPDARLTCTFKRDPARRDVTYRVKAASALTGPWETIAESIAGASTTGPAAITGDSALPGIKQVTVRDTHTIGGNPQRYLKLELTR